METDFALIPVDEVLLEWAQQIVCMTEDQKVRIEAMTNTPVVCLDIDDTYAYRDEELMKRIAERYNIMMELGQ